MRLHIITPVVNEADNLRDLLPYLVGELRGRGCITVADGGSTDGTAEVVAAIPRGTSPLLPWVRTGFSDERGRPVLRR